MMKFSRAFLKSPSAGRFLPPCAAVLLFALPFLLLTPQKAAQKQEREDKHVSYVLTGEELRRTAPHYLLTYHDPKSFLFAPESLGFGLFRTIGHDGGVQTPPLLMPDLDTSAPQAMTPAPLPRREPAFRTPLLPARSADISAADTAAAPEQPRYPLLTAADGDAVPLTEDGAFSETAIRGLSPRGPTVLFIQEPLSPDAPWTALLLSSSGMPQLDSEALRRVDIMLLDPAFREKLGSGRLTTVHWLPPETEIRISAEEREEERPAS